MDIGNRLVTITGGSGDAGTVLHMKGHTGAIRIMTTIAKAGECTRDIGTMRTTTMAAGETMITVATIMIALTNGFTFTTSTPLLRYQFLTGVGLFTILIVFYSTSTIEATRQRLIAAQSTKASQPGNTTG